MGIIKYDGKKLIPAPILSISRDFQTSGDGTIIGSVYQIAVNGTQLPYKGSPNSSGVFHTSSGYPPDEIIDDDERLQSHLNKQKAILELFNSTNMGKKFEILNDDTASPVYFYPKTVRVDFTEGIWFNDFKYSIILTADNIYPNTEVFTSNIDSAQESWSIEPDQQNLDNSFNFRINHNLSAKGKNFYNASGVVTEPWIEARNWVLARDGINHAIISSGVYNLSNLSGYNHLVTTNIDKTDGVFTLSESWIMASGIAYEDFNINTSAGLDGLTSVSIEGSITGFEHRNLQTIYASKWQNASGYFLSIKNSILDRAQDYSDVALNPIPLSETIGRNPIGGTINYSYEYNNRPSMYISGAKSESIIVAYNGKSKAHARVPVIGRAKGPVLQALGTSEASTKNLSIEFVLGPKFNPSNISGSFEFPYNLISGLVNTLDPINLGASKSFYGQPQQTWEPMTGRASFNIEWTYE